MSDVTHGPADAPASVPATHPRAWPILLVVLSATFVQLLDVSIVGVAIPDMRQTLGAAYGTVQLVLSLYSVGFASMLVLSARLGDIFGRRRMFLIGMSSFAATSMLCAVAPTVEVLVLARVLQGASSALMFAQVLVFIQLVFGPRPRTARRSTSPGRCSPRSGWAPSSTRCRRAGGRGGRRGSSRSWARASWSSSPSSSTNATARATTAPRSSTRGCSPTGRSGSARC